MIQCWLNRPALRRHLDEGAPLPSKTQTHLENCPSCRALLTSHRSVIAKLTPAPPVEAPFLHVQIMRAVASRSQIPNSRFEIPWPSVAFASLVLIAAIAFAISNRPTKKGEFVKLTIPQLYETPTFTFEQPIETELENLKKDTRNAARALAANFLPSEP